MHHHWILDEHHQPVLVDLMTWARWYEGDGASMDHRRVAFTELAPGIEVSTVFLGIDHSFGFGDRPLLFESMAFTDYGGDQCDRYATWEEAEAGHARMVEEVRAALLARVQEHG